MKQWLYLAAVLILSIAGLAACSAENPRETPADPAGPALIMFYTDN